jgi:hypothetical protein
MLAVLGCAVSLSAMPAFAQDGPQRPRDLLRDFLEPLPAERVVRFALRGQELSVSSELSAQDGARQVHIEGLVGTTEVRVGWRSRGPAGMIPYFELGHHGPARLGGDNLQVAVSAQGGSLRITRTLRQGDLHTSVILTQDSFLRPGRAVAQRGDRVTLRIRVVRNALKPEADVRLTAGSFAELLRKHPGPAAQYLAPVFREFGGQDAAVFGVDPAVAWQLFPDALDADEALASKVLDVVERMNSDDFAAREAAAAELDALGGPAVLVLGELDRSALSAEQNTRIDSFLAKYRQLAPAEVAALLQDPEYLLRCFTYSQVEPLRAAAVRALDALVEQPVNLAASDPFPERLEAAAAMREQLPQPAP